MYKYNSLVENLEKTCDLKTSPEVGKWYAVPTYPMRKYHLPVYLPAHEDGEIFNFPIWHYHIDYRFYHNNAIKFFLKEYGIYKNIYKKYIYIDEDFEYLDGVSNRVSMIEAYKKNITDENIILESWYKYLCSTMNSIRTLNNGPDFQNIKWKAQMCIRNYQIPNKSFLYKKLLNTQKFKSSFKYCGKCPHKGINLNSVQEVNGIKTCPAHGGKWKISEGKIKICEL